VSAPATTARLDVDRPAVGRVVSVALGVLASIAFGAGYASLAEVARWSGMSDLAAWTIPAVIDLGMVVLGLSAMVQRARHEPAGLLWSSTAVLVGISISAQVAHAMTAATVTGWVLGVAVAVACTPPATTLVAAEAALRLVVATPVRRTPRPKVQAVAQPVSQPAAQLPAQTEPAPTPASAKPSRPTPAKLALVSQAGDDARAEVARLAAEGLSHRVISERVDVSRATVGRWLRESDEQTQEAAHV